MRKLLETENAVFQRKKGKFDLTDRKKKILVGLPKAWPPGGQTIIGGEVILRVYLTPKDSKSN